MRLGRAHTFNGTETVQHRVPHLRELFGALVNVRDAIYTTPVRLEESETDGVPVGTTPGTRDTPASGRPDARPRGAVTMTDWWSLMASGP